MDISVIRYILSNFMRYHVMLKYSECYKKRLVGKRYNITDKCIIPKLRTYISVTQFMIDNVYIIYMRYVDFCENAYEP